MENRRNSFCLIANFPDPAMMAEMIRSMQFISLEYAVIGSSFKLWICLKFKVVASDTLVEQAIKIILSHCHDSCFS